MIKNIKLANISDAYSATSTIKFDTLNDMPKYMLCVIAVDTPLDFPITSTNVFFRSCYSKHTLMVRNWMTEYNFRDSLGYAEEIEKPSRNDSKLNVTIELNVALAKKKKRLRVWGYKNSEYIFLLHGGSLTLKYKTYTIKSLDVAREA